MFAEIVRDMTTTPREFAHGLRLAFGDLPQGGPMHYRVDDGAAVLEIHLEIGPERRIAQLRMDTLIARLRFVGGDEAARLAMLRRMDMAMQRGGG